jgi:hypothetical protein
LGLIDELPPTGEVDALLLNLFWITWEYIAWIWFLILCCFPVFVNSSQANPTIRLQFVEWKFWFCSLTITRIWLKLVTFFDPFSTNMSFATKRFKFMALFLACLWFFQLPGLVFDWIV